MKSFVLVLWWFYGKLNVFIRFVIVEHVLLLLVKFRMHIDISIWMGWTVQINSQMSEFFFFVGTNSRNTLPFDVSIRCVTTLKLFVFDIFDRFVRQQMDETYENSSQFDVTYLMFVWVAFLPTIISPVMYSLWIISGWVEYWIQTADKYGNLFKFRGEIC